MESIKLDGTPTTFVRKHKQFVVKEATATHGVSREKNQQILLLSPNMFDFCLNSSRSYLHPLKDSQFILLTFPDQLPTVAQIALHSRKRTQNSTLGFNAFALSQQPVLDKRDKTLKSAQLSTNPLLTPQAMKPKSNVHRFIRQNSTNN